MTDPAATREVPISVELVRRLVDTQLAPVDPVAAAGALVELSSGWDNVMFRLGQSLTVRLPHRAVAVPLTRNEARWLPVVADLVPVSTPTPVFVGAPQDEFPWPWLVCRWIDGQVVDGLPVDQRAGLVDGLADALVALHRPAPAEAPINPVRGVPMADRSGVVRQRILDWDGPSAPLLAAWDAGLAATAYPGPPLWLHGDPHPLNLVHRDGVLSGLLDFGDITAGDPANDLATAWWTFGPSDRRRFIQRVDAAGPYDPDVWIRAAGWAAGLASAMDPGTRLYPLALHTAAQLG